MNNIIQHFHEKITSELGKEVENIFLNGEGDITKIINLVKENLDELGCKILKAVLEDLDQMIKESAERKKNWVVQQSEMKKTLITVFGEVQYFRVYYKSKGDQGFTYLVDDIVGIERYQRLDEGLTAKMVALTSDFSYQKSVELAVSGVKLSRQTAKNKIRQVGEIDNSELDEEVEEKRKVKRLYVEADEDHIALQHGKKKTITRLVYVHEGVEKVSKTRNKLKSPKYFSGLYKNRVEDLWLEVIDYIYDNYELDEIETIYLAGDGAEWIKAGLHWLPKVKYILDRYHLNKYVTKATGHRPKMRFKLWEALNECDLEQVEEVFAAIIEDAEKETKLNTVKKSRHYILSNWSGIVRYREDPNAMGCSAEGHVSHILAHRMSSRPMGWSIPGAEQMSRLRAFKFNGGTAANICKLLKRNKKEKVIELQTQKMIKRKTGRSLYAEPKEVMPAIKRGLVDGTYRAVKAYAF